MFTTKIHSALIRFSLLSSVCVVPVLAAQPAQPRTPDVPGRPPFSAHLNVTGSHAGQINLHGSVIRRDTVIFYEHAFGLYPRVYETVIENGGVPQLADLGAHLDEAAKDLQAAIPDPNFTGYACIDWESWSPCWDMTNPVHKNLSELIVRNDFPDLPEDEVEAEARRQFEDAAKIFTLATLQLCKSLRPHAKWGLFNYPSQFTTACDESLSWMYEAQTGFFPCIYADKFSITSGVPGPGQGRLRDYEDLIALNISKARMIAGDEREVQAYVRARYYEGNSVYGLQPVNNHDLRAMVRQARLSGADGVIFWDYADTAALAQLYTTQIRQRINTNVIREVNEAAGRPGGAVITRPPNASGL